MRKDQNGNDVEWENKGKRCGACAEKDIDAVMCNHVRGGKTKQDHASGAWSNRFANRAERVSWLSDGNADNKGFPRHTCNGKKNRFHV